MARSRFGDWKLTDHVCRACFGRVLASETGARCADCGLAGRQVDQVCACGVRLHSKALAGLRCLPNPSISIDCPSEIVVSYVGNPDKPEGPVKPKHYGGGLFDDL
jgi:hypothetical protein